MSNKIVLLTTDTAHHLYYAWKLRDLIQPTGILIEQAINKPTFETFHPIEKRRDEYEKEELLKGAPRNFNEVAETHIVPNCNDDIGLQKLENWAPDWIFVFGTGFLKSPVIKSANIMALNHHGGDPEYYRGLDSHYWAIYNNDFNYLVTTLHVVENQYDTGDIVGQKKLSIGKNTELFQLRAINTQACVDLSSNFIINIKQGKTVDSRPQKQKGRYYSFMPSELKEKCVDNFQSFVSQL